MTPRRRAFVGAIAGALLVLSAQKSTRPEIFAVFGAPPRGGLEGLLTRPGLAPPSNLDSAAAYLHAGAERLRSDEPLSAREKKTLLAIAREGERGEPTNPFWTASQFVFQDGRGDAALHAWRRASRGTRYDDHQTATLRRDFDRLKKVNGDAQGWMYAAIAPRRSASMVESIRNLSLRTLHVLGDDDARIEFAYETIRIGASIRDGSKRLSLGQLGIQMIEGATYPPELSRAVKGSEPYRLWIAKTTFTANLRRHHRVGDAAECDRQFRVNDGWQVFGEIDPQARFRQLALASVLVDTLPGGFLVGSLVGGLLYVLGWRIERIAYHSHRFRGAGLTACSLALLLMGIGLGYPLIGIAAGACALVPALAPERPRRLDGTALGPLHAFVLGCIGTALMTMSGIAAISRSLPGEILPELGTLGALFSDTNRLAAAAVAFLGASALVAPAWALVRRYPTPAVAAATYRNLGRFMVWTGLVLAVVSAPLSLMLDRNLGNSLAEISLNEQVAYNPSEMAER